MTLVRVPIANTIGKSVRINPDATVGATIGTDLKLPDGTVPSLTELAAALASVAVAVEQTRSFTQLIDTIANSQVPVGAVTQHEAALTIGLGNFDTDTTHILEIAQALQLDDPDVSVSSNGTVVTFSVEQTGGGDLRIFFSDGVFTLDSDPTPATIALTPGTDTSPQVNYVYIPQSTKVLTVSTSSWPAAEHSRFAVILVQSAASVQTDGTYKTHAWTDHTDEALVHHTYWMRSQPASWKSGTLCTPTVGAATFDLAVASGDIQQMHDHAYPAFDTSTGSEVMLVNQNGTPFDRVGNLVSQITDANGVTMSGKYYNLVVWGVVSEDAGDCQLMVNLPTASYNNSSGALLDADATTVYDIPTDFIGTGFLIARLVCRHQVGGNTYTIESNIDLRGKVPSTSAGGTVGGGVTAFGDLSDVDPTGFSDNDLMYWAGGVLIDTAGNLTWDGSNLHALSVGGIDEANLVDKTADEDIIGEWTHSDTLFLTSPGVFAPAVRIISTVPVQSIVETDAALDEKAWDTVAVAGQLRFRTTKDDYTGGVTWMAVDRTGSTVDLIAFSGAVTAANLNVSDWDTAFGWGNHAVAGYLTSFTEINDLTAAVVWANVPLANIPSLPASQTTSGAFATARIPSLAASKITSGIFAAGRVATHTGDVTGQTALTLAAAAISGKSLVTAITGDMVLIWDATDSALKRVDANDFLSGGGSVTMAQLSARIIGAM